MVGGGSDIIWNVDWGQVIGCFIESYKPLFFSSLLQWGPLEIIKQ